MKIVVILLYVFLISCSSKQKTCFIDIICDPGKKGECDAAYKEAQELRKLCESGKQ